ncbi:hypothetical protein QR680_009587 [Steinernema hermaphroditum]|uniref:Integrase zinc-binding domain-containing protein n=1 Tax=Steinernema hermaphroditum TaxID=289476 RepID=A0AA39IM69_9BILA|nr:hypothetical protein QR680_009587 [Steinernema hermaphroditum]
MCRGRKNEPVNTPCCTNSKRTHLSKRYFWSGIYKDVHHYIEHCHECQVNKSALCLASKKLRPIHWQQDLLEACDANCFLKHLRNH